MLESTQALVTLVSDLSRLVYDLLIWTRAEVGVPRIADEFIKINSIMPQKRNQVVLGPVRVRIGWTHGDASTVATIHPLRRVRRHQRRRAPIRPYRPDPAQRAGPVGNRDRHPGRSVPTPGQPGTDRLGRGRDREGGSGGRPVQRELLTGRMVVAGARTCRPTLGMPRAA